jgi:tRNA-binding protein
MPDGQIDFDAFAAVKIHTGTIVTAELNPKARVPAYVLTIDFGALGKRTSSAQLTQNYTAEELVGKQIVAVMNFPVKRIAGIKSEVLVLGAVSDHSGVVLLEPSHAVPDGAPIA